MKKCRKCHEEKPESEFPFHSRKEQKRRTHCKTCYRAARNRYHRAYRKLPQAKAQHERYYQQNKERLAVWHQEWRAKNKEKIRAQRQDYYSKTKEQRRRSMRRYDLARLYGMSPEHYANLVQAQRGLCAICGNPPTKGKGLGVDHDHQTGKARGLLCTLCNAALGAFKDDPGTLETAAAYIRRYAQAHLQTAQNG